MPGPMSRKPGGNIAYAYAQDPENGQTIPRHLARRLLTRRAKIALSLTLCLGVFFLFSDVSSSPALSLRPKPTGTGGIPGVEDIWSDQGQGDPEPQKGWGGWGLPFGGGGGKTEPKASAGVTRPGTYIAPAHPDLSLLPPAEELFSDISIPGYFRAPESTPFPDTRLREVIDPHPPGPGAETAPKWEMSQTSFHEVWEAPDEWEGPRGEIRRVQWEGFAGGRDRWENDKEKKVREERREAVRRGFGFAWQAYKDHAWGHDEVRPVSRQPSDPFNGWGASIVDTLDTLLVMGLSDEYNLCRPHINQLNFQWVNGRDWANGYTSEAPPTDDDETPSETWSVPRDRGVGLAVFETTIRYLGGLLGAYDLSGDQLLLTRAIDLADVLSRAFNTESGIPGGRIDPGAQPPLYRLGQISIAEAGSMSLEFMRLSQITGNRTYFDLAQRTMDFLDQKIIPRTTHNPLIPLWIFPDASQDQAVAGALCFGGLADSYYEYLIKTYKLLGASPVAQMWKRVYEDSIDTAKKTIYTEIEIVPDMPMLAIGKLESGRLIPEIEHLTCFAGAMLGLGAKLLNRDADMIDAERITQSCYWLSAATPSGLQPEVVEFYPNDAEDAWETVDKKGVVEHKDFPTVHNTHEDRNGDLRWNVDDQLVYPQEGTKVDPGEYETRLKGRPPGAKKVVGRGLNRPETIESIFYMYRLTGDRKWQEKGWKMYVSWVTAAKVAAGLSSIDDVTKDLDKLRFSDNMESFAFAETFKYHFLLQSEPDVLSLDDYVLNTEAHPFIANPDFKSGHGRFWHPPADPSAGLGVRGQGTDVQKWKRLDVLQKSRGGNARVGGGGGRGMGGGGGDPNNKPQPPGY